MEMLATSAMSMRRTLRASAFVGAATFVVSILAFVKNFLAAHFFGISGTMDAFNVVVVLPNLLAGVLFGALQASLVPVLVEYRQTLHPWLANKLVAQLIWRIMAVALTGGLLFWLGARWFLALVGSGLSTADHDLALRLVPWAAVLLPMNVVIAVKSCQLIARNELLVVSFLPGLSSLLAIALLLFGSHLGTPVLVYSLVLGTALQIIILFIRTPGPRGEPAGQSSFEAGEKISVIPKTFYPLLFASSFGLTNALVDQSFASPLGEGSVTALAYANALNGMLSQVSVFAAATVLLPTFSQIHSQDRPRELGNAVRNVVETGVMIFLPLTAVVLALGHALVWFLLGGGNFGPASANLTSRAWSGYAVSLAPLFCGIVLTRLYHAIQKPKVIVWAGVLSLAMNAGLDFVLSKVWGVLGIALSTSLTYVTVTALLLWHSSRQFGPILSTRVLQTMGKAVLAGAVAWYGMNTAIRSLAVYQVSRPELLIRLMAAGVLGAALYLLSGAVLKMPFNLFRRERSSRSAGAPHSRLLIHGDLPLEEDTFEA